VTLLPGIKPLPRRVNDAPCAISDPPLDVREGAIAKLILEKLAMRIRGTTTSASRVAHPRTVSGFGLRRDIGPEGWKESGPQGKGYGCGDGSRGNVEGAFAGAEFSPR